MKVIGGLGNQLFQYALGRSIAMMNNTILKLDVTGFEKYKLRDFELSNFKMSYQIAVNSELPITFIRPNHRIYESILNFALQKPRIVREKKLSFDSSILALKGNLYLDGYWQSPKYFLNKWLQIRNEFDINAPLNPTQSNLLDKMLGSNSVSLHVRRGDYTNPKNRKIYSECTSRYYNSSVEYLKQRYSGLKFYIFSDDSDWVKGNLDLPGQSHIVEGNSPSVDLKLMSSCRHSVIANSTFSWWAGFLKDPECKEGVLISPKRWFVQEELNNEIQTIMSEQWIRL